MSIRYRIATLPLTGDNIRSLILTTTDTAHVVERLAGMSADATRGDWHRFSCT